MHEYSLVRSLLRQVRQIVAAQPTQGSEQPTQELQQVSVSIGPLSGVEPELVQIAFDQLVESFGFLHAKLSIVRTTLDACCAECGECFSIQSFKFQCPSCCSRNVRVTSGEDFRLIDLTVVEDGQPVMEEADAR
jgi:hydrogenase nickel incorporation protein HypA/HybF